MKKYILIFTFLTLSFVVLYNVSFRSLTTENKTDKSQKQLAQKQHITKKTESKDSRKVQQYATSKKAEGSKKAVRNASEDVSDLFKNHEKYEKVKHLTYEEIQKLPKRDRPDLAALQNFEMTADPKLGYPPAHRKLAAYDYARKLLRKKAAQKAITGVEWKERGPNNFAGRTKAIMFDPNDATAKKVWAGSITGGLWVNNDITSATSSWTPVNNFMDNLSISALAYDPANKQTFYMGTGLGFTEDVRGLGIWKTTDGGSNWTQISSTNSNADFYFVQKIVVTSASVVLASTSTGVMRSTDGGSTWTKVLTSFSTDIEIASNGNMFAADKVGKVYKSTDNGQNWADVTPKAGGKRVELAVSPSNPDILYAVADGGTGGADVAWFVKSTNGGSTWKDITIPKYREQNGTIGSNHFTRAQAWYDLILSVHPTNPNVLLAGGIDVHRTLDGGTSWTQISDWVGNNGNYAHADQHAMLFRPGFDNEFLTGTDGGVFLSQNITDITPAFLARNKDYNVTTFYSVAVPNTKHSNFVIAGSQDNGTIRTTDVAIGAGSEVTGGDGAYCFIDQDNANLHITSTPYNSYYLSQDAGKTFKVIAGDQTKGRFINPAEYDSNADILYAAGGLNEMTRIANIAGNPGAQETLTLSIDNRQITHIKASPHTANRLFIGVRIHSGEGKLYRIDQANTTPTVTEITGTYSGSHGGWVSSIDVGANDSQLLATFSNYGVNSVYESNDGGSTWTNKSGNLPDMPIRWGLYNPNDRKQAILATEVGVWSTDDLSIASPVWEPTNTGLANVRTDMIKYRSSDGMVAIATYGRGVFTTNIFSNITSADFYTNQTIAYQGVAVQFTNNSLGGSSWSWNFGDSNSSTSKSPSHTYANAGTYTVTLTINGGASTKTETIKVLPARSTPYATTDGGNFEVNQGDFAAKAILNGISKWELGTPTGTLNTPSSGNNAWKTGLTTNLTDQGFNYISGLYSPSFSFASTTGAYKLKFKKSIATKYCNVPALQVEYTTDGGQSWSTLGSNKPEYGAVNWYNRGSYAGCRINRGLFPSLSQAGWTSATEAATVNEQTEYDVSFLKGNASVAFRFVLAVAGGSSADAYTDGFMIDDFEIAFTPPVAEFDADNVISYVNTDVQFNYRSSGATSFSWNFGDGGTANTENPTHKYTNAGVYDVSLTITGSGGNSTKTLTGYITILPSASANYGAADGGNFDVNASHFAAQNVAGTKFERGSSSVAGKDGTSSGSFAWVTGLTDAQYADNSEARLYTPLFDFSLLGAYKLEFKAKYKFEAQWDGFIVQYSTDQGKTWFKLNDKQEEGWYNQISDPQSVFGSQVPMFSGTTDGFATYSTDVSFLSGNSGVTFRFLFLTDAATVDAGLALDDFVMTGPVPGPAVANFTATNNTGCTGQIVTFNNTSTGSVTSLSWDFGANASPRTANGIGPHEVIYSSATTTTNTVKLTANGSVTEEKANFVTIAPTHSPDFTIETIDNNTVILTASAGDAYQWYKDGAAISGATGQKYTATIIGQYSVAVTVGGCAVTTKELTTGINPGTFAQNIKAYPVPSQGRMTLELNTHEPGEVYVSITDLSGKTVYQKTFAKSGLALKEALDLSGLGKGVYILKVETAKNSDVRRVVIN